MTEMPETRGKLTPNRALADLTWLRVGGPADWLFQPADIEDLAAFLRELPEDVDVFPMGVGSNLIVRDGGLRAVVIRMGALNAIEIEGNRVTAGVAALMPMWRAKPRKWARPHLPAHHSRRCRRGGEDECRVLWHVCCGCFCRGQGGDAGR